MAPALWGCYPHWMKLPYTLRRKIWAAYKIGQEDRLDPTDEYLRVAKEVQQWIQENIRVPKPLTERGS